MTPTISERLAQFSDRLQFDDIPPEVVDKTRRLVLDTLGVCIGSTRLDFGVSALGMVAGWGGAAEATAIGGHARVPAQNAALCNGILGHGQDYDDTHTESVVHPSAALVPAALALAEREHASGRDMLTALVAGLETGIRIALPALNKFHLRGMHTTSVATTFGTAMMAAKLQKLGLQKTIDAVGIGGSFASGLLECIPAAAGAKRLHAGWGAFCGILSAQFAQGGFTGPATIFEGKLGVYNSFLRGEDYDLGVIFKGMGRHWEILDVRPKLYPCCHYLQAFLDCAAALRKQHSLRPDHITGIACRVAPGAVNIVCEPWAKKLDPRTGYDVRFSLAFAVAVMLAKGKAGVAEFSEKSFADPVIRQLMGKVRYTAEPRYEVKDMPGWVEITLRDGTRYTSEIPEVRGNTRNPIALEELLEKYHANTTCIGREAASRIADAVLALDEAGNVDALMAQLAAPARVANAA